MGFPDRLVRFEAAFAIAGALPQKQFTGQERVVPLLAEALSQTGQTSVVIVGPSQDMVNGLVDGLKKDASMNAVGAINAEAAVNAANALASIDAIIITDEMDAVEIDKLMHAFNDQSETAGRRQDRHGQEQRLAVRRACLA